MRSSLRAIIFRIRNLQPPTWMLAAAILWVAFLSFGVFIPFLGMYADDWPFVYVHDIVGFKGVIQYISWMRPFAGPFFAIGPTLFAKHFWMYHAFLLVLRSLDAVLLFWVLRLIWPDQKLPAAWAGLLFVVFPAFKQQALALEYFPHFIVLGMYFVSIGSMILAVRRRNKLLLVLSVVLSFQMFPMEYFLGQEALRPFILWICISREEPRKPLLLRLRRTFIRWLPYLFAPVIYVLWSFLVQGFPRYQPELINAVNANPLAGLTGLISQAARDLLTTGIGTWVQVFSLPAGKLSLIVFFALVLAAFVPLTFYLLLLHPSPSDMENRPYFLRARRSLLWVGLGLVSMVAAGALFWVGNLPIQLTFPWDRTTLAFIVGVPLFTAGLISLIPHRIVQALVLSILVSFSVGLHSQNANLYRKEWALQNSFYWQLAWRAPGLQPGTAVVLGYSPFNFHVDKFLTPVLDWTYDPSPHSLQLDYAMFDFHKIWGNTPPAHPTGSPIGWSYGTLKFKSDDHKLLFIAFEPPGCLRILTSAEEDQMLYPHGFRQALGFSNPDVILPNPPTPAAPPAFMGPEPAHSWCYYYEKADLARQSGDWTATAALGDAAAAASLTPQYPAEWLLFAEAYARTGRFEDAEKLSRAAFSSDNFFHPAVCSTWQRIARDSPTSSTDNTRIQAVIEDLSCQ